MWTRTGILSGHRGGFFILLSWDVLSVSLFWCIPTPNQTFLGPVPALSIDLHLANVQRFNLILRRDGNRIFYHKILCLAWCIAASQIP